MKPKFNPKLNKAAKAGHATYKDESGVKRERVWWVSWAEKHGYIVEQVKKPDRILIRDSRRNELIKTLTKI